MRRSALTPGGAFGPRDASPRRAIARWPPPRAPLPTGADDGLWNRTRIRVARGTPEIGPRPKGPVSWPAPEARRAPRPVAQHLPEASAPSTRSRAFALGEDADHLSGRHQLFRLLVGHATLPLRMSTGNAPNARIATPTIGTRNSLSQAMKRIGRGSATRAGRDRDTTDDWPRRRRHPTRGCSPRLPRRRRRGDGRALQCAFTNTMGALPCRHVSRRGSCRRRGSGTPRGRTPPRSPWPRC